MKKINYIAAFHYGDRMNSVYTDNLKNNKFYIFEEHLKAITEYHSGVDLVTFTFNLDKLEDETMIRQKVDSYICIHAITCTVIVIKRSNL